MFTLVLTYFCGIGDVCQDYVFTDLSAHECYLALEAPENIQAAARDQGALSCENLDPTE